MILAKTYTGLLIAQIMTKPDASPSVLISYHEERSIGAWCMAWQGMLNVQEEQILREWRRRDGVDRVSHLCVTFPASAVSLYFSGLMSI